MIAKLHYNEKAGIAPAFLYTFKSVMGISQMRVS